VRFGISKIPLPAFRYSQNDKVAALCGVLSNPCSCSYVSPLTFSFQSPCLVLRASVLMRTGWRKKRNIPEPPAKASTSEDIYRDGGVGDKSYFCCFFVIFLHTLLCSLLHDYPDDFFVRLECLSLDYSSSYMDHIRKKKEIYK
jgi:hypothetical protein